MKNKIRLFVNVDHVATIREARKTFEPDPLAAALLAEKAGANGITVHLREDRRHVQDDDVFRIREKIHTVLNLEMAAVEEMVQIALKTKPYQVSIVPEKRQEITTEGGLNVISQKEHLKKMGEQIQPQEIRFSLFVDPDPRQIDASREVGAESIEINTGLYSELRDDVAAQQELEKIRNSARHAAEQGLRVFAGHGLTDENVVAIAGIPEIEELNIGHSLVSRSVYYGLEQAVKNMMRAIQQGIAQQRSC
jgi:pyridoxine 5-phosphate synthase